MASILIADDENIVRSGIRSIIERAGTVFTEICECSDGREALEMIKNRPVDLVITDIKMPEMDGLELIQRCSELRPPCLTKFIILSGHQDFHFAKKAIHYGVKDYLLKPVGRLELLETIQKIEKELQLVAGVQDRQLSCAVVELVDGKKYSVEEAAQILHMNRNASEFDYHVFVISLAGEPGAAEKAWYAAFRHATVSYFEEQLARQSCVILCSKSYGITVLCEASANFKDYECHLKKKGIFDVVAGISQTGRSPGDTQAKLLEARQAYKISCLNPLSKISEYCEQMTYSETNKILMAMQYINEKYSHDIGLACVSNYVSLNYNYFSALFRKQTGKRFINYLTEIRILKSKPLLLEGRYRINEIAHMVGYENPKQFAKVFRQLEGVTPFDYSKR